MLTGLTVLELGDLAAVAGRLLGASGATVVKADTDGTDPILRPWRDRFKTQLQQAPYDLLLDGRPVGREAGDDPPTAGVVRVTPFGEAGPWAGWRGNELVHQALSGFMGLNGYDDPALPPVMAAGHQAEITAGAMAAIAALLVANGAGRHAATSWHEALAVGHETELAAWTDRRESLRRITGRAAAADPDVTARLQWRCADDRYVNCIMPALTRARFAAVLEWLESRGMAADLTDERWQRGRVRLDEERHVFEVLGAFVATMTADEAFEGGQARNLPWGVVRRPEENRADPQFVDRPISSTGLPWRVHVGPPSERRPRPIQGLRVLDFSWQIMGPTATRTLAHAGADVVKVERKGNLDLMRHMAVGASELFGDGEGSPFFRNLNAGKRSLALDVVADRETALRLVETADVVVENFSSRVMERLGLGFDQLRAVNPAIVYVSLSGFGHEGPKRDYDTWGPTAQAISGCTWLSQLPGLPPAGYGYSYLDYLGGYMGTVGLLAALWATRRDGRARWVDVSQVEVGMFATSLAVEMPDAVALGNTGPVVRAADGLWVAGIEGPVDDAYAAVAAAQAGGVAAGVIQGPEQRLARDPQLACLGTYPVVDGNVYEATPIRIDGAALPISGPAPRLGQHTEEVLAEWLT